MPPAFILSQDQTLRECFSHKLRYLHSPKKSNQSASLFFTESILSLFFFKKEKKSIAYSRSFLFTFFFKKEQRLKAELFTFFFVYKKDKLCFCERERETVNQWISESVNQWISESVNQWISESVNQWISESVNQWISESVNHALAYGLPATRFELVTFRVWDGCSNQLS